MNQNRRDMLRIGSVLSLAIGAGLLTPAEVFGAEWKASAFEAKTYADALKALGGDRFAVSKEITLDAPDIAENGAAVPIAVASTAPGTDFIAILIENNPSPLAASFNLPAGAEPAISTRFKMNGTSNVHALVKANGKWLIATKEVKVILGGCAA
jgi:sulfur-oxidizing protein SoxY